MIRLNAEKLSDAFSFLLGTQKTLGLLHKQQLWSAILGDVKWQPGKHTPTTVSSNLPASHTRRKTTAIANSTAGWVKGLSKSTCDDPQW